MLPGDFQEPRITQRKVLLLGLIGLGGVSGLAVALALTLFVFSAWLGLPLDVFGFNEGPDQPIQFPHTVHVQELGLDCTFCHRTVTKDAAASIPAVGLCMTCHKTVGDGNHEIDKLRGYYETNRPIDWVRVHRVPDHVHFVHEAHIRFFSDKMGGDSETCSICHGDVGGMEKVNQVRSLKMSDCVDCHRNNDAPTDCTTCHY